MMADGKILTSDELYKTIFWIEAFEGEAKGGYYVRAFGLADFFEQLRQAGEIVVGIVVEQNEDNIEVLVKKK